MQSALFQTRTMSLTASTALERDQIALSVQRQAETVVGTAAPGAGVGQTGTTATASWMHSMSERIRLGLVGSYTMTSFQTAPHGSERFVGGSVGLSYLLSESVSSVIRYTVYDRRSDYAERSFAENILLIGVTKRF